MCLHVPRVFHETEEFGLYVLRTMWGGLLPTLRLAAQETRFVEFFYFEAFPEIKAFLFV